MNTRRCFPRRQTGVGMIEVLVTVLVLSIAFLGMAALQAVSLSTNNSAMARSLATISAYSILDAMRADIGTAKAGSYNTTVKADNCPAAGGTLATRQINGWCRALGAALGATSGTVGKIDCVGTGTCTVTISFDDSRAGASLGSNAQTFTTQGML